MIPHIHLVIFSVRQGHPADVVALCGGAVDLDLRNKNGDTPLHIALKEMEEDQDRFEIVQELICCGAECKQCVPRVLVKRSAERPP